MNYELNLNLAPYSNIVLSCDHKTTDDEIRDAIKKGFWALIEKEEIAKEEREAFKAKLKDKTNDEWKLPDITPKGEA